METNHELKPKTFFDLFHEFSNGAHRLGYKGFDSFEFGDEDFKRFVKEFNDDGPMTAEKLRKWNSIEITFKEKSTVVTRKKISFIQNQEEGSDL